MLYYILLLCNICLNMLYYILLLIKIFLDMLYCKILLSNTRLYLKVAMTSYKGYTAKFNTRVHVLPCQNINHPRRVVVNNIHISPRLQYIIPLVCVTPATEITHKIHTFMQSLCTWLLYDNLLKLYLQALALKQLVTQKHKSSSLPL